MYKLKEKNGLNGNSWPKQKLVENKKREGAGRVMGLGAETGQGPKQFTHVCKGLNLFCSFGNSRVRWIYRAALFFIFVPLRPLKPKLI